ncbi:MAG: TRAP transporter substrate-binding protein DctP [Desulfatibacillaceae bacterium]
MTRRSIFFVAALLACAFLVSTATPATAEDDRIRWKFATLAPDGVGWAKHVKKMIFPVIERETEGRLETKIYWGGVMGDDEDYVKKMRVGQLHGAGLSGQGVNIACPEMSVVELPFLFRNYDEVDHIKKKMRSQFDAILEENGYMALSWLDQDFDQIYSARYPMTETTHFENARFMTWYGPIEEAVLERLGANPVPINVPEATTSVRQGVVDTVIGPAIYIVGAQMYTIVKYINPVKIRYSPALVLVTTDAYNMLPMKYHRRLEALREDLERDFCALVRSDNAKCLQAMKRYGVTMVEMSDDQKRNFRARVRPVWEELAGDVYPRYILDELIAHLEHYRRDKREIARQ